MKSETSKSVAVWGIHSL